MYDNKRALRIVSEILANRQERYAWKTAKYLSKQLGRRGCHISKEKLEDLLIDHTQTPNREIRYSIFPAKKSLDLLWGHVSLIGELRTLPNVDLDTEHEYYDPSDVPADAPWCFLSHSHRNLKTVLEIRDKLRARNYGAWLFEAEISEQARITEEVKKGLAQSQIFIVYMSRQSLMSRWVLKETLVAFNNEYLEPFVVVDAGDRELTSFFHKWLVSGWADVDLWEETRRLLSGLEEPEERVATTEIPGLLVDWAHLRVDRRHLVLYPDLPLAMDPLLEWDPKPLTFDEAFPQIQRPRPLNNGDQRRGDEKHSNQ
jgi:hypothetical protein